MTLWLQYHGAGLAMILLALVSLLFGLWFPVANMMAGGLFLVGILRACEGHEAWQDLLKARREWEAPC